MPWAPESASLKGVEPTVVDDMQLRWFDHFLKGQEKGVLDSPVSLFVMGAEEWRDYPDWPPPAATPERWFLHSDGRANSRFGDGTLSQQSPAAEPPDVFTTDPLYPAPRPGGHSCCLDFVAPMGPADQRRAEEFNSSRVYCYQIALGPVGVRIAAGNRLRLSISGSDFPQWDRNLNTGGDLFAEGPSASVVATQTVLHTVDRPSHLTCSVIRS
jgi:predicted acyl esterase